MNKIENVQRPIILFVILLILSLPVAGLAQEGNQSGSAEEKLQAQLQQLVQRFEAQNAARDFSQADATLGKALALKDIPTLHYMRGRVQFRLGQFKASVKSFVRIH